MSDTKFKNKIKAEAGVQLPAQSTSKALTIDSSGNVVSSTVTDTELSYVSGVTSPIQTQLGNSATDISDLVTLSGVAANSTDLGSFTGTIIPDNSTNKQALQALETAIDTLPDPMEYKGVWDASTNTPTLTDGTGNNGDVYQVTVAGTQFTPAITFAVGDKVVYSGATGKYEKWDMTDSVISVNGQNGIVVLDTDDVSEGATNLYFTDERAQDAVGTIVANSTKVSLTYDDGTPSITADIISGSLVNSDISASAAITRSKLATGTTNHVVINDGSGVMSSEAQLSVSRGGTGVDASTVTDGQILIGNDASNGFSLATLTQGSGITITNGAGSITIAANSQANPNDIPDTAFTLANNQTSAADVTGFVFSNAAVRGFQALASVARDATSDVFEVFTIRGIQKGASWDMDVTSTGDDSGIVFSITNAGQIQYTSSDLAGHVSSKVTFRAQVNGI